MQNLVVPKGEARRFGLDLLRAVAVLSVVYGHALGFPPNVVRWVSRMSRGAIIGVELFFVLSGFLIGGILIDLIRTGRFHKRGDLLHFWARRWFRTLPAYYLFLFLHYFHSSGRSEPVSRGLSFVFFLQNFASEGRSFYRHAWSLSVEEHFYLLFPLLCFLLIRSSIKPLLSLLISASVFLVVPILLRAREPIFHEWYAFDWKLRQVVVLRLDALMYGIGMAVIFKYFPEVWERLRRYSLVGLSLVTTVSLYMYFDYPGLLGSRWLQVLGFPLVSLGFALVLPWFYAMKRPAFSPFASAVTYLSTISYSLYLSHILVIFITMETFQRTAAGKAYYQSPLFFIPLLIGLSLTFGAFVYHAWEYPFLRLRERVVPKGPPERTLALSLTAEIAAQLNLSARGDKIVITAGLPRLALGSTNTIHVPK